MDKVIYTIPAPNSIGALIEVYGEPENAWYEWRIIDGGRVVQDTGTEGHSAFRGGSTGRPRSLCVTRSSTRHATTPLAWAFSTQTDRFVIEAPGWGLA